MKILVTGSAGFIGFHLSKKLIELGHTVVGIDNINTYYSEQLKLDRLKDLGVTNGSIKEGVEKQSSIYPNFSFSKLDITNYPALESFIKTHEFDKICHLAAQAGVRYSIEHPWTYINTNITGFLNLLQAAHEGKCGHIIYASSSSVYGNAIKFPFVENDITDQPESIYAATKKTNEMMAFTYKQLYNIESTGLRFFTVYGPWGRPDMAPMLFADAIFKKEPIKVFNNGNLYRDFTYIDDIVEGIIRVIDTPLAKLKAVYNIGNGVPVKLSEFINILEYETGIKAKCIFEKMQLGDVFSTYADTSSLKNDVDYQPKTTLHDGIKNFIEWYRSYFQK